jgi:hypothetical protein
MAATGQAPTLGRTYLVQPGAGSITATGLAPAPTLTTLAQPAAGTLVFTGQAPTLGRTYLVQPGPGSITVTGLEPIEIPSVTAEQESPDAGTLTFTGYVPTLARDHTIPVGAGSATFTGQTPAIAAFSLKLYQGASLITTWPLSLTSSLSTQTHDLEAGERATITDWSALRFALVANGTRVEVTWLELETPSQSSLWYAYPGAGSATFTGQVPYVVLSGDHVVQVPTGTLIFAGQGVTPVLGGSHLATIPAGTLAFTGLAPTAPLGGNFPIAVPAGSLAFTGTTPTVPLFTLQLWQGDRVITSWESHLSGTLTTTTHDLTTAERNDITDWARLRYVFIATHKRVEVTWAELEVPAEVASNPSPASADLALTGWAPTAYRTGAISPAPATLGFTGHAPDALGPGTLSAPTASLTFTGHAPTLTSPHIILVGAGSMTFTGTVGPTSYLQLYSGLTLITTRGLSLTDSFATYNLALTPSEIAAVTDWAALQIKIVADGVQISVSWLELSKTVGRVEPAPASGTWRGYAPTLLQPRTVTPGTGSLTMTGQTPSLYNLTVPAGSLTFTGHAPTLQRTRVVTPGTGAMTLAGQTPSIGGSRVVAVPAGSLALTGQTFEDIPAGAVSSHPATMAFTGHAPRLWQVAILHDRVVVVAPSPRTVYVKYDDRDLVVSSDPREDP